MARLRWGDSPDHGTFRCRLDQIAAQQAIPQGWQTGGQVSARLLPVLLAGRPSQNYLLIWCADIQPLVAP
jgi:hypothetical protein